MANVPHHTMHGPRKVNLIFVIHGDTDEEFSLTSRVRKSLSQLVPSIDEIIRITGDSRVSHMGKLRGIASW